MRLFAATALALLLGCSPPPAATAPSQSQTTPGPVATASAVPRTPAAFPSASGTVFSMEADGEMHAFFADRGALVASSTRNAPSPYLSRIQRADAPAGPWRAAYETDARFDMQRVSSGRIALIEYRQPPLGTGGHSEKVVIVDLDTGAATLIDEFALSAATFRGGGGGPRGPSWALALGADAIAWTRLIEGPAGSVTGELRVAALANPGPQTVIGSSAEWIAPLAVDARRLVYVVGGKTEDQLRVRDLASGLDRVVAVDAVGDRASPYASIDYAVVTGDWAVWQESIQQAGKQSPQPDGSVYALNLRTGDRRTMGRSALGCGRPTAGTRYIAWFCGRDSTTVFDASSLERVVLSAPAPGLAVEARDDGLIWFEAPPASRRVFLFRPRN